MAKKKEEEVSLDELEDVLEEEIEEEFEEEEIEEIPEFSLEEEVSEEEEIGDIFEAEEGLIEEEYKEEYIPEEEIIDERIYTVPLAKGFKGSRRRRAKKAMVYLKEFFERHFKPEALVVSQEVNEKIWERGIQHPPRKIKIRATKNTEGLVVLYLA
ncbi:MAG: 50S ribosomal protein L31e [Promethearchaeia archaeon]